MVHAKHWLSTKKYHRIDLWKGGRKKNFYIHRLVATAFLDNTLNKQEVNHKNFNKADNSVDNLEWISGEDNIKHYQDSLVIT